MKRLLLAAAVAFWGGSAWATPPNSAIVVETCGTIDPLFLAGRDAPLTVDVNGTSCINGTFTGTVTSNSTVKATAADPTYVEGSSTNPVSVDLSGYARSIVRAASGAFASGSIASGAVASGAYASGSYAAGAISDGADVTLGAKADATCGTASGTCSLIALIKYLLVNGITPLGQTTMSASIPVTVASDQSAMAVKTASGAIASGSVASGAIASGAYAAGSIGSGAIASGAIASGAVASGAVASGAYASGSISDGADVTQGAKADARSTATDTTAITAMQVWKEISFVTQAISAAVGATAAAPPASAVQVGAVASGATGGLTAGLKTCDLHAKYDSTDNGNITLVTGVSGRKVYVCGYILANGGTATNLSLTEGSDANCATNNAGLTPVYQILANQSVGVMSPFWAGLAVSTNAYFVCVKSSAGNSHQAEIWYTIQ